MEAQYTSSRQLTGHRTIDELLVTKKEKWKHSVFTQMKNFYRATSDTPP